MWDLPPLSTVVNTAYREKKGYKILSRGPFGRRTGYAKSSIDRVGGTYGRLGPTPFFWPHFLTTKLMQYFLFSDTSLLLNKRKPFATFSTQEKATNFSSRLWVSPTGRNLTEKNAWNTNNPTTQDLSQKHGEMKTKDTIR
jgi:hypothetical protein